MAGDDEGRGRDEEQLPRADDDTEQLPPIDNDGPPPYRGGYAGGPDDPYNRPMPVLEPVEVQRLGIADTGLKPLVEPPSKIVARYLFPTEKFRGEWRKHWVHLSTEFGVLVLATIVLGFATGYLGRHQLPGMVTVAVLLWLGVIVWVGWRIADWNFDRFVLTNKRIMAVSGLVTRRVAMMPLLRVTDMKYDQTPLGRVLRYGTFVLESAGQEQALREIKHLPNPNELYLRIVEEMYEPEAVEARLSSRVADEQALAAEDGS
ncbi:MAG TPA: PH domain-containing protein [Micromonosporaceae bacterium]